MTAMERASRKIERAASAARIALQHAQTQAVVRLGICPHCGATVRRNSSMRGWYQCAQSGAVGFRLDASKPACDWQGFTE